MAGIKYDKNAIRNWVIYKITSPSGRIYIGKTSNYKSRILHYKNITCKCQAILYKSLKKYGYNNHIIEIIDEFCSNNGYANGKEIFWIRSYMSNYSKWPEMRGLNLTDGGEGTVGRKATKEQILKQKERLKISPNKGHNKPHTEETKKKMKEAQQRRINRKDYVSPRKGIKVTDENKKKLSILNTGKKGHWLGKKFSEAHCRNMSLARKGKPNLSARGKIKTPEEKEKLSKALKGKPAWNKGIRSSEATKKKLSEYFTGRPNYKKRKKLLVYDKNLFFIKEVSGVGVASKEFNVGESTILRFLSGETISPRKYIFKYKDESKYKLYSFNRSVFNRVDLKEKIA